MLTISRNDACWCGSGKKYKKCHLDKEEQLLAYQRQGYLIPSKSLIRTPEQIEGIRKSGALANSILDWLDDKVVAGVTTNQIDQWVHQATLQAGAISAPLGYKGYPKSICTSLNQVICHGIPNEEPLREGDILNIDITTILDGYYGDVSKMYTIGAISAAAQRLVDCAKRCMELGIEAVKPYQPVNLIGEAIEPYAQANGFSVVREFGGHGVGVKFHDDPFVHHYRVKEKGMILVPGMVFTIEPMINEGTYRAKVLQDNWTAVTADGGLSAQWEHTVVVTETGVEILTV